MALQILKNTFKGAIEGISYITRGNQRKSPVPTVNTYFNNFAMPVFGIDINSKLSYCNLKFQEIFKAKYDNCATALLNNEYIYINNQCYIKQFITYENNLKFYLLTQTQNTKNNISTNTSHTKECLLKYIPSFELSTDGKIQNANNEFYRLVANQSKTQKSYIHEYIADSSIATLKQHLAISKKKATHIEVHLNGDKPITLLMYISYDKQNQTFYCLCIDITEYKNLEMHLIHSQKMQAIGQLAGGISHDFNNLLTAMLGFCDLLLMKHSPGDPSFAEIMQIKQNANRAANLVRQLLAISRKQVLQPKILDITNVIAELMNLLKRLVGAKVKLQVKHSSSIYPIKCDQGQLEQVIINLVVNARDAIADTKEQGSINIETKNASFSNKHKIDKSFKCADSNDKISAGDYILISIKDTGIGIDKSIITHMFEPFFSTKEPGSGTGLGLSTVYGIVKQTGGYLYVKSEKNKGTEFQIYLKASVEQENEGKNMLSETDNKLIYKDLTGEATILLVEDETPVRIFSSNALSNKGYNVIEAENGEKAFEIINKRGKEIDIIITDVIMPGMNGPSFIKEVQKKYPKIKVIFMSGYAEEAFSEDQQSTDEDFNFLSKPFSLKQLASKVKEVLEN